MSAPPARKLGRARGDAAGEPHEVAERRLRRREARDAQRRRGLLRLDVSVGVFAAIALLLATPGVAYAAVIALLVLAACVASVAVERRRSRRRRRPRRRPPAARDARADRRRSLRRSR
jgi:Flp pilus assembly protein TadB